MAKQFDDGTPFTEEESKYRVIAHRALVKELIDFGGYDHTFTDAMVDSVAQGKPITARVPITGTRYEVITIVRPIYTKYPCQ